MSENLQYRKVTGLEYVMGKGEMKIFIAGIDDTYYSTLDTIDIPSTMSELNKIEIQNKIVKLEFSKPIICNVHSGRYFSSMICGAKMEGIDENLLVEKLGSLESKLGPIWEESVKKRREEKEAINDDI
jgi:hypothetical protein